MFVHLPVTAENKTSEFMDHQSYSSLFSLKVWSLCINCTFQYSCSKHFVWWTVQFWFFLQKKFFSGVCAKAAPRKIREILNNTFDFNLNFCSCVWCTMSGLFRWTESWQGNNVFSFTFIAINKEWGVRHDNK